jgi:AraC-like DNA-binding protein
VDATRIECWLFGSTKLFCPESPGLDVVRTGPSKRLDPMIALCFQTGGTGLSVQDGNRQRMVPGDLLMIGPTSPNEFVIHGATAAIEVPFDEVGISVETAERASERLPASPLFSLVAGHLFALRHAADAIGSSSAAATVGAATALLVRALIVSAAEDDRAARRATTEALWPLIVAYVDAHLTEPDLSPARIARANNISLRYLYKVCAGHDVRPGAWIIDRRLRGARKELEGPSSRTVAEIARRWGFVDPAHFSERFRHAFGMSPRECRILAQAP